MKNQQDALLTWYKKFGRHDLIWRNTTNLYYIYVSEIMLQQTQVNRVQEKFYPQFLEKFPTLEQLANSDLDEVISAWSGLGYYSRARNLHKTAQIVKNKLPQTQKELLDLPGIGEYTSSAICSFGLNQKVPVVDTNIARVIKRFFALKEVNNKILLEKAKYFLNTQSPREHNLALMDLGAMICVVQSPTCDNCPLENFCLGKENPTLYTKKKKIEYEKMELFYGVKIKNNQIALIKSTGNMYKNMLELPTVDPIDKNFISSFKHAYTKYRLDVNLYEIDEVVDDIIWIDLDNINQAPLSSLVKKAIKIVK